MWGKEELERLMNGQGDLDTDDSNEGEEATSPEADLQVTQHSRHSNVKETLSGEGGTIDEELVNKEHNIPLTHLPYKRVKYDWKNDMLSKTDEQIQNEQTIGPTKPSKFQSSDFVDDLSYGSEDENLEKQGESSSSDGEDDVYKEIDFTDAGIPFAYEANLSGHTKNISCIAIDHIGTRMFTGAHDYKLHIWDLPNMDKNLRSFRVLEPIDSQPVTALHFNHKGNVCLVVGSNAKPRILNREGRNELELMKGDMYIRDQHHTKGHTGVVTSGWWHPTNLHECVTSSFDGSIRIWDTTMNVIGVEQHLPNRDVLCCRSEKGLPAGVWNF